MHSALFVATIPTDDKGQVNWRAFQGELDAKLRNAKTLERLAENVWLAGFASDPSSLAWLVVSADKWGFAYRILPFAEAPQWLRTDYSPKTKVAHNEDPYQPIQDDQEFA
jgi:hypothetical protein